MTLVHIFELFEKLFLNVDTCMFLGAQHLCGFSLQIMIYCFLVNSNAPSWHNARLFCSQHVPPTLVCEHPLLLSLILAILVSNIITKLLLFQPCCLLLLMSFSFSSFAVAFFFLASRYVVFFSSYQLAYCDSLSVPVLHACTHACTHHRIPGMGLNAIFPIYFPIYYATIFRL